MQIFKQPNFNFIRWRWHAIALSLVVIAAGLSFMWSHGGMPLGIDFKGGSIIILKFEKAVHEDDVRAALEKMPGEKVVQQYGAASAREILVRLPQTIQTEEGGLLDRDVRADTAALQQSFSVFATTGQAVALRPATTFTSDSTVKTAAVYKADDFIAAANGVLSPADTSGSVPTSLTALGIGMQGNGSLQFNGHIRRLTYWPQRLSNTTLQAITQ